MKLSEFNYNLPVEYIAQNPAPERDESKLLIYDRKTDHIEHTLFKNIIEYLSPEDVLVINNSRVMPARLFGKINNYEVEILLIENISGNIWECMVKPGRKFKTGVKIIFNSGLEGTVVELTDTGRLIKFNITGKKNFMKKLIETGKMPLPPYITGFKGDPERYQTIYSKENGSSASSTAGLHFTENTLKKLTLNNIKVFEITLHIGPGTFQPLKNECVEKNKLHREYYEVKKSVYKQLLDLKKKGNKIAAVGTTVVRTLETVNQTGKLKGYTEIFIYPGYKFKIIDKLITNFHLPKSSLLLLLSAFIGKEKLLELYSEAKKNNYRFYSFGDAMFIC